MSNSQYKIIFTVGVFHSFFAHNECNCLQFVPTPETQSVLRRYGFKINPSVNGFGLYTNSTDNLENYLTYISSASGLNKFEFNIESVDADFQIYTNLPVNWQGQLLFTSNNSQNTATSGSIQLQMNLEPGNDPSKIGTLNILFSDITSQTNKGNLNYEINFTARSTQWQYNIINQSNVELDQPSIKGKSEEVFDGPVSTNLANGQNALLFSSQNLLPLSQVALYEFNLVNEQSKSTTNSQLKKISGSATVFKGLPNASPSHFSITEMNGETVISSPMYIYI